ncbi:XRE family transcriptional regulator [Agromyces sp. Root81]|uniref:helix-turn-helix domain-containing protein n=1 Tax=Agromyces sp. Root81 TaxID=1736601 RepID=UPI0006FEE78B|nr:helix-turn-helix transcriptional regulator [Agromyces sp. Root81]KRC61166.1 XRE family transcriptional regulator [Agromyces sp. Root81]
MVRLPHTLAELERGERLGALLRRARGERSMLEVALDAGVSPETLRKIETGRVATPAFSTIAAITEVLGLSLDAVWAEVSRPAPDPGSGNSARNARERLVSAGSIAQVRSRLGR